MDAYKEGRTYDLVLAQAVTGVSKVIELKHVYSGHTWVIKKNGTCTGLTIALQGSLDAITWFNIDSSTATADEMRNQLRYI